MRALTICVVRELPSEEYSIKVAGNPAGTKNFIHFDIYGWSEGDRNARPKGGVGMASRALYYLIRGEYGKHTR